MSIRPVAVLCGTILLLVLAPSAQAAKPAAFRISNTGVSKTRLDPGDDFRLRGKVANRAGRERGQASPEHLPAQDTVVLGRPDDAASAAEARAGRCLPALQGSPLDPRVHAGRPTLGIRLRAPEQARWEGQLHATPGEGAASRIDPHAAADALTGHRIAGHWIRRPGARGHALRR